VETNHVQRITEQQLSELAKKYADIRLVIYQGHELVFRNPKRAEAKRWRGMKNSDKEDIKGSADEALAQWTIEYVDGKEGPACKQAFLDLLDRWPMLVFHNVVGTALIELCGLDDEAAAKKSLTSSDDTERAQ